MSASDFTQAMAALDAKVENEETIELAKLIHDKWHRIARIIEPEPYEKYEISAFKDSHGEGRDQAQNFLDAWTEKNHQKATKRRLIKALLAEKMRTIAVKVFGQDMISAWEQEQADSMGSRRRDASQGKRAGGPSSHHAAASVGKGENEPDSGPKEKKRKLDFQDSPIDVCIVTAVDTEFAAAQRVLEWVTKQEMIQKNYKAVGGGKFPSWEIEWPCFFSDDGKSRSLKIALLQQTGMGVEEAAKTIVHILTTPALVKAKVVAMTGVCGGDRLKVKLGDLLIPFYIVKRTGKEKSNGEFEGDVDPVKLDRDMKGKVNGLKSGYKWKEYIPDKERDVPSPALLQDTILAMMKEGDGMGRTKEEIAQKFHEREPCWKVDDSAIKEALDKLKGSTMLAVTEDERLETTEEGLKKAKDVESHYKEYPTELKDPGIHTKTLLTIDVVSENLDFKKARKDLSSRKIYGVDMEGYSFLDFARTFLKDTNAVFIKGVSDLVSESTKMDYYQPYCAASATAFLCHLLKSNPDLFN